MKTADISVALVDHMGSDLSVTGAARVSFDKQSEWEYSDEPTDRMGFDKDDRAVYLKLSNADAKLIKYLAKHNHWTPFGHSFATFRIKAPLFVAAQLKKHTVGLVWNEVSRRYVDSEPEFYVPKWRSRAANVKQGSGGLLNGWRYNISKMTVKGMTWLGLMQYQLLLKLNVAPEQARTVLPQSMMTEFIWSGSLMAFARVAKLRLDPHTQIETQIVADGIAKHMSKLFPVSWAELMAN